MMRKRQVHDDPRVGDLHRFIHRVEWRFRLSEAARLVPWAVGAGLLLSALLAGYLRFEGRLGWQIAGIACVLIVFAAGVAAFACAALRPRDPVATARHADVVLNLDERLSTALEAATAGPERLTPIMRELREAQLDDALARSSSADLRGVPVALAPRGLVAAGVALVVLVVAALLPLPSGKGPVAATPPEVAVEAGKIEGLADALEKSPQAQDPALRKLLEELRSLSADLRAGDLSREEAVARLSEAEARLERLLEPQTSARREALRGLAEQLARTSDPNLNRAAEALQRGEPDRSAQELAQLADALDTMTEQERRALAETLRRARDRVAALDQELASRLNDAAAALEEGNEQDAREALDELSQAVEDASRATATQRQVEQALAQIQASKGNVAQAGVTTPVAATALALGTRTGGTPIAANLGTGTPVIISGTQVSGTPAASGTAVMVEGAGTPVVAEGSGGQEAGGSGGAGQGQASSGWGRGHQEPVYSPPTSLQATTTPVGLRGQENPGGEQSSATTGTDMNTAGPSLVPYEQVYGEYEDRAGKALDSDYIPQGYKEMVRDYFTEISPR